MKILFVYIYGLNMDHKILLFLILTTKLTLSFQDKKWNPYCNKNGNLEIFEEFCCPICETESNKEKCRYECPIDYYRFGNKCYGGPDNNIDNSMPSSPFVCNRKCPKTHYGIALNETKICVSCSILCLDTSIETSCSCAVSEKDIDMETVLIITNIATALLLITCISISCYYQKRKMDKRRETEIMGNCTENYNIEAKVEQLDEINGKQSMDTGHTAQEINDNKTMDTDHEAKKHIAMDAQIQHEKITRYKKDPTFSRKKKKKKKERVKSSDYANVSSILMNELLNSKTISRPGLKEKTHNSKFTEDIVIEHNTTSTQPLNGDDVNCLLNIAFAEQAGQFTSSVPSEPNKVQGNKQNVPGNEHKVLTVIKTTQLSKSNVQESENMNDTIDKRDTTNIKSKTGNSISSANYPLEIENIAKKTQNTNKLLHDTNRRGEHISVSTNETEREIRQKDEPLDSIKQVTFAADTNTKTKFQACTDKNDVPFSDQTFENEIYENFTLHKTEINNLSSDSKLEEQTDRNYLVKKNKSLLRIADRGSKTSTNSNKSTISSSSKSTESDVSKSFFTTAPSGLSEVEDTEQYLHNEFEDTDEQIVYENIPYLSEMGADLKQNSESHTTEIDDLYNGATSDTKIHSVKVLNSLSENVDGSQLVTTIDNRVSSGSDESYHSAHDQCLSLESQEALVKNNVQHNAITTGESIDMKTITSQTNMSFNNSTVNLVINQSN